MFRKQITIALACAGLIGAFSTVSTIDTSQQNATSRQPVLVARGSLPGGGSQGSPRGGHGSPHGGKPARPTEDKPVQKA
jgi:hypothetical protein